MLSDIMRDVSSSTGASAFEGAAAAPAAADAAEQSIAMLDRAQTRMQAAASALGERTRWRARTEQLEAAFATGDLGAVRPCNSVPEIGNSPH